MRPRLRFSERLECFGLPALAGPIAFSPASFVDSFTCQWLAILAVAVKTRGKNGNDCVGRVRFFNPVHSWNGRVKLRVNPATHLLVESPTVTAPTASCPRAHGAAHQYPASILLKRSDLQEKYFCLVATTPRRARIFTAESAWSVILVIWQWDERHETLLFVLTVVCAAWRPLRAV